MNTNNIVLIGMPGVGKSTIGVILAKILGYRFIDSDLLIQEREGKLLSEIISEKGLDEFINIEAKVNTSINTHKCVIATGGSAVYSEQAMNHLRKTGTVIYLTVEYEQLKKRLSNLVARGVVLKPGQTLLDLYNEREKLYKKYAHLTINETGLDVEKTIACILSEVNSYKIKIAADMN